MHIKGFDRSDWDERIEKARREIKEGFAGKIIATDISAQAVAGARKNAAAAGVEDRIEFAVCDYAETPVPEGGGMVVLNPEYGERVGQVEKLGAVYRGIGDFFKQKCQGYRGFVFTGNLELAKKIGLKATRKVPFFNSTIECRLFEYELYPGSREKEPLASGGQPSTENPG